VGFLTSLIPVGLHGFHNTIGEIKIVREETEQLQIKTRALEQESIGYFNEIIKSFTSGF
jgi:hypothetical protein